MTQKRPPALSLVLAILFLVVPCLLPAPALSEAADLGRQIGPIQLEGDNPFPPGTPLLEVFFIDLGRADGIFLRAGGQTLLVDGGHRTRYWRLKDFLLRENGSITVDSMLNTHQHDDHVAGLIGLLQGGGSTRRFYSPLPATLKDPYYKTLGKLLKKAEAAYIQIYPGDLLSLGGGAPGTGARPLADAASLPEGSALLRVYRCEERLYDANASSAVLHVSFGERSVLLTADAAGIPQHYFAERYGKDMKADVLKSAHHGVTATVPSFLESVDPALMVVTSDAKHSKKQTLQVRYLKLPTLYSADGTLYMATDGQTWYIHQQPDIPSPGRDFP